MPTWQPTLTTPAPPTPTYLLTYPSPHILLITINRPASRNALPYAAHWEAHALLTWFDAEPALRVAILTGAGPAAFCAGQDLLEQHRLATLAPAARPAAPLLTHPPSGFMGVSRQTRAKPLVAAVNGAAMGGGFEIVLNCDLVVASPTARFALPEASRGLFAAAGGLARLVRIVGLPVASEIALAGRELGAAEARALGVVNVVAASAESVVEEAVALAERVGALSPDAVVVTKAGLRDALREGDVEAASRRTEAAWGEKLRRGENLRIGLAAFANKEKPQWVGSKL